MPNQDNETTIQQFLTAIEKQESGLKSYIHPLSGDFEERNGFVIQLPSFDTRPDVKVEVTEKETGAEALVTAGLHEQLFVWPFSESRQAIEEVIGYVQRITRSSLDEPYFRACLEHVTDGQRMLVTEADQLLRSRGAVSDIIVNGTPPECDVEFHLLLPPERLLEVTIRVGTDVFEFEANGADLRLYLSGAEHEDRAWVELCTSVLQRLLDNDLTIRTRISLTGKRTGAVYIPSDTGQGYWNGELFAYKGIGRTQTFQNWWSAT